MPKIRILVVDDSVVVRRMLTNILSADPDIEVVGAAANGSIALAKIPQVNPDSIVLDLEMPDLDGLATLAAIRKTYPRLPIIMFSAITQKGAEATLDALALGASDYVTKPANMSSKDVALQYIQQQLIPKIKVLSDRQRSRKSTPPPISQTLLQPKFKAGDRPTGEILAIGVSTGGPNALSTILPALPANFPLPIVIVQHMPPVFTQRLAERLTSISQIPVKEGMNGDILQPGRAWIAPGDYHMIVEKEGTRVCIRTHQDPPENSCRPAVDVLFRSVAKIYQAGTIAVVLTGMGQDGLHGCQCIREAGGQVLVQDEGSSVVWGMPGIIANAGLADSILPLNKIAGEIIRRAS